MEGIRFFYLWIYGTLNKILYYTSFYGVDITPFLIDGEVQKDSILLG
jgi:hypothetical protein